METLNLPTYSFNLKSERGKDWIFDSFRRRWVVLTPEEWVRQNMAQYLVNELGYPGSLILLEGKITLNKLVKRCDILVYDRGGKPVILGECKSPDVKINQKVFDQISRYNITLGIRLLLITNGIEHFCLEISPEDNTSVFLPGIPHFRSLADHSSLSI